MTPDTGEKKLTLNEIWPVLVVACLICGFIFGIWLGGSSAKAEAERWKQVADENGLNAKEWQAYSHEVEHKLHARDEMWLKCLKDAGPTKTCTIQNYDGIEQKEKSKPIKGKQ